MVTYLLFPITPAISQLISSKLNTCTVFHVHPQLLHADILLSLPGADQSICPHGSSQHPGLTAGPPSVLQLLEGLTHHQQHNGDWKFLKTGLAHLKTG